MKKKLNETGEEKSDLKKKKPILSKGMTFLNVDFVNNQQEVDIISQRLITRFNEIKQTLESIPLPVAKAENSSVSASTVNTPARIDSPMAHFRKSQSAK